jgi:hypothetical protein
MTPHINKKVTIKQVALGEKNPGNSVNVAATLTE